MQFSEIREKLSAPFNPDDVMFKPQTTSKDKKRAMAVAYLSSRDYEDRLDEVCPDDWHVEFTPWGPEQIICRLTICGVTRCSTGESDKADPNAATIAEAQAFKRACSKFGLGRYLYSLEKLWVEFDPEKKQFTAAALKQLRKAVGATDGQAGKQVQDDHKSKPVPQAPPPAASESQKTWPRPDSDKLTPDQVTRMKALKEKLKVTQNTELDYYVELWMSDARTVATKKFGQGAPLWLLITKDSFESFHTEMMKRASAPTEDM